MGGNPRIIATIDIAPAAKIDGWMSEPELVWLAEQACTHSHIVEVGSFLGRSTRALADHTHGYVVAFDDWRGPRDVMVGTLQDETGKVINETPETLYNLAGKIQLDLFFAFMHNLGEHVRTGKVVVLRADHGAADLLPVEYLRGDESEKPDMVFIDGNHDYEDVKRDLLIWKTRIRKGGLLCGHDASMGGVMMALSEFVGGYSLVPNTDIWYVYA